MMIRIDVFSLLPETMAPYLEASVLGKVREKGLLEIELHNIRDFAIDRHHVTDDEPFGGGGGMVMKPEPMFRAVETILGDSKNETPVVLLTPQGRLLTQRVAAELSNLPRLALLCGRYEGVDERVRQHLATDEISVGDYVLTGGELPALILIDALARLLPGALGDENAAENDSHSRGLLEGPHYTRPAEFRGWEVPQVLRSGDHKRVERWRVQQALLRTLERRPDLLDSDSLTDQDRALLDEDFDD